MTRIGFGFAAAVGAERGEDDQEMYKQMLGDCEQAQDLGFRSVWFFEHHFSDWYPTPSPPILMSHVAARLPNLELGTCVLVLPWHNPIRLAEEIAMIAMLTDQPLHIGLGRGTAKYEFDRFGLDMSQSRLIFNEAYDILRKGLAGETFTYDGDFLNVPFPLTIRPTLRPDRRENVHLYASVASVASAEIVGRSGLGPLAASHSSLPMQRQIMAAWEEAALTAGHRVDGLRPILVKTIVAPTDEEAIEEASRYVPGFYEAQIDHYMPSEVNWSTLEAYAGFGAAFEQWKHYTDASAVPEWSLGQFVGSPNTVADRVSGLIDVGFNRFLIQTAMPGAPLANQRRWLDLFAKEVIPRFAGEGDSGPDRGRGAKLELRVDSSGRLVGLDHTSDLSVLRIVGPRPDSEACRRMQGHGIEVSEDGTVVTVDASALQHPTSEGHLQSDLFTQMVDSLSANDLGASPSLDRLPAQARWDGPLTGMRVVEVATVLMAPYASQLLGDMGADVVKVESERLDSNRMMGRGPHPELSGVALNLHRNKRSVRLDLESADGQAQLHRLMDCADIFITNLRPSSLKKFALDPEEVCRARPDLIYAEAHGYPSAGPSAEKPAFDDIIQAATGIAGLAAEVDGSPRYLPMLIADKVTGLLLAMGVLGAAVYRATTGLGQRVEVPMFDAMLAFTLVEHLGGATTPGGDPYYRRILSRNRGPFQTEDSYISVLPYSDKNWRKLYEANDREEFLANPKFATQRARHENSDAAYADLGALMRQRSTDEWLALTEELEIASSRVEKIEDIVTDPEKHKGVLTQSDHSVVGPYLQIQPPIRYSRSPMSVRSEAPLVGRDTDEVLSELATDPPAGDE